MTKKIYLTTIMISFFAGLCLFAQTKKQVLIFATTHKFDITAANDFSSAITILRNFNPDIICTEFIDKNDTLSLNNYNEQRLIESEKLMNMIASSKLDSAMQNSKKDILSLNDEEKLDLGNLLFIKHDYVNSFYTYFKIMNPRALNGETYAYEQSIKFLANGEFQNIIFPLAAELGIKHLYAVDDQTNSNEFQTAYENIAPELKAAGRLAEAMKIQFDMESHFKQHEKSGDLLKYLNSAEFRAENESLFNLGRNLDSKFAKDVIKYWDARNLNITKNIINRIESTGASKTIVAIGGAHVSYIKNYLLKNSDYEVITMDEID